LDPDWIDMGSSRIVTYTNLPAGRYGLQIRAASSAGLWSEPSEALVFMVKPLFWQTGTFWALVGATLALGILAKHRARVTHLQRQRALEQRFSRRLIESQETERQRIAAELHDSVGQKLLIIKNSAQLGLRDAASRDTDRRYGRSDVAASNVSTTARMRAPIGMSSPRRPSGYPVPSQRS
jgi:signal transduction histidine kinase